MPTTLAQLADAIGAELRGDGSLVITGCNTLEQAGPDQMSFLANPKYLAKVGESDAGAVVVTAADAEAIEGKALLIDKDPYYAFRQAVVLLHGFKPLPEPGIHPSAVIDPTAKLGQDVHIGPFVHVAAGASVGDRAVLISHVSVGEGAALGADCLLYPNVTVYHGCVLGDRVTLHAGCSIGHDGFGYATHHAEGDPAPAHHKIPQTGIAVVEDDCELGANCSVDRATLGATVIARGSKFSNNVVIGHGSAVGPHNLLVAQVGLAGSVTTGGYVAMGGQAGVAGHLHIGDQAQLAAQSGVMHDLPGHEKYGGVPAVPLKRAFRNYAYVSQLPDLHKRLKQLEKRIEQLEQGDASAT